MKKAKEIWFLCRQYSAEDALAMGLVNAVVLLERLEEETVAWCQEMLTLSPFALRLLKASFHAGEDGMAGLQQLAHDANLLFYASDEAKEGREAFREGRPPDFERFPATRLRWRTITAATIDEIGHRSAHRRAPARARRASGSWRPARRRLPAAIAPVLVGTPLALGDGYFRALAFAAALLGAIFIQVGTNLSNDYSDARRGADSEDRLGPVRVTAGGLVPPRQVLIATYVSFGLAVLCGCYLIAVAGWALLAVGAASILAGVLYTGGPRPYGYEGLGELFVFLFFGIVAVTGSYFVQVQALPWQAFVCAVPVGLLASAILVVNNLRDIESDRRAGKRTLAVRLGRERTRALYCAMLVGAFLFGPIGWLACSFGPWVMLSWLSLPLAFKVAAVVRGSVDGPSLNRALAQTGALQLIFCILLSAGSARGRGHFPE